MPLRFGFADTLSGQLHFRACGAGPDIVLLPWAPASGRMYDQLMPHLARAGFRAIAFDLAGTGRSHKNCRNWTVQQYATDVLEACGSLHTVPYTVIGGRFGASVAVEMLLASPAQVTGAVLDGVLGLAPEELRKMTLPTTGLSPKLADDGAHRSFAFDVTVRMLKDWDPGFELTAGDAARGLRIHARLPRARLRGHRGRRRGGCARRQADATTCWRAWARSRSACWS